MKRTINSIAILLYYMFIGFMVVCADWSYRSNETILFYTISGFICILIIGAFILTKYSFKCTFHEDEYNEKEIK